ncbi:MAG: addiction module antitoxin RelB [Proteobacteria bacterium]|nr:addiction module antitoxin RelB [Pseudomonadota bacterium]
MKSQMLEREALRLPLKDRARLALRLVDGLDESVWPRHGTDPIWLEQAMRHARNLAEEKAPMPPADPQ